MDEVVSSFALKFNLRHCIMVLTVLYSFAGRGIAIVNDFKSIEGDRQGGMMSLPVAFGTAGGRTTLS